MPPPAPTSSAPWRYGKKCWEPSTPTPPKASIYSAVIYGLGERKEKHTNKAQLGQAKAAGTTPKRIIRELRLPADQAAKLEIGKEAPLTDIFEEGQHVDVQGLTRGRGFTGVMRRWNFSGFPMTHGTHEYRRHGGSIGTNMTPGRTLPNVKMGGQYGNETVTTHNVKIAKIDAEAGLLLIEGSCPGAKNGVITIRGAVKKKNGGKKKKLEPAFSPLRPPARSGCTKAYSSSLTGGRRNEKSGSNPTFTWGSRNASSRKSRRVFRLSHEGPALRTRGPKSPERKPGRKSTLGWGGLGVWG